MDDKTESLPDDALAQILRRLPPRDLAVSRCVRKAWCAIVDGRRLLLRKMLPHAVRGLFFNYGDRARPRPRFFASPSSTRIDSDLSFLPSYGGSSTGLVDHCGGLLLHRDRRTLCVINPATRRWEDLPWEDDGCDAYLVFDPAESLHYQVFSVPRELEKVVLNPHDELEEDFIRWPPSIWTLDVFSSSTRQWKKRSFVREAEAPETMADARLDLLDPLSMSWSHQTGSRSVYWRGSLYVHFYGVFVVRLSFSNGKYRVIKTPINNEESIHVHSYVGKSENGVYFATVHDGCRLQVWTLMESSGRLDWVSKKHIDLGNATLPLCQPDYMEVIGKTWISDDDDDVNGNNRNIRRENLDWDSDDDNIVNIEDSSYHYSHTYVSFLGFHPYKEVVFLALASYRRPVAVAFHLNSSKFQYLGTPQLADYSRGARIQGSFPYTPCVTGHLLYHFT
ncbi:uncharacterized protein LOC119284029 [Triticum dicoccoides]|uniref:uncharacterized protein LOC119284029 n=1 Tax=Triticum dicoccoides TaxID=85692 RepID=UPI00188DD4FE|nr:uncharacterized protein LOC119284029 [Triticum dicoccoides]